MSGSSHISIREPQSVARLSRTFSRNLTTVDLAEPLLSLDENQPASAGTDLIRERSIPLLGVRRAGTVAGWVTAADVAGGTLGEHARTFDGCEMLEENASLDVVLTALTKVEHVFVVWLGEVAGVVTRHDLQKPPLRMWLFGAITVLDMNLTRAIEALFPADSWQSRISAGRFEKAGALRAERERRGSPCQLIDCLQIKDKADILLRDEAGLAAIGLTSRREAERMTSDVEKLRNYLAHAQELEAEHLATAARLAASIHSIVHADGVQRIIAAQRAGPPA